MQYTDWSVNADQHILYNSMYIHVTIATIIKLFCK